MEVKRASLNQFVHMRRQAKSMTEEMKSMYRDISTVKGRFDAETETEDKEHQRVFKEFDEKKKGNQRKHQQEIGELRDELKVYDPVEKVKRETESEREKVVAQLTKMENDVKVYRDFAEVKQKHITAASQYEEELEQSRQKVAAECLSEQRSLRTVVNAAKELDDSKKLLQKLKIPRPQEQMTIPVSPSLETEEAELKEMLQIQYNKGCKKKREEIAQLQKELDAQIGEHRAKCDAKAKEVVGAVATDFPEDGFYKSINEQYQAMYKELEAEYNGIEEYAKPGEIEIEPMKERLAKVQDDIDRKRKDLNENFERILQEEENRFNGRARSNTVDESNKMIEEQKQKNEQALNELDSEIAKLETELWKSFEGQDKAVLYATRECNQMLQDAMRDNINKRRELQEEIQEENQRYSNLMQQQVDDQYSVALAHGSQIEALRVSLQEIHKKANAEELEMVKSYQTRKNSLMQQNKREFERVNRQMTTYRQDMEKGDQTLTWALKEDQLKYEAIFTTLQSEMDMHRQQAQNPTDYTSKINRLTIARNRAKSRFEEAGARDKERIEIDMLESIVAQRNLEFSKIRRELIRAKRAPQTKDISLPVPSQEPPKTGRQEATQQSKLPRLRRSSIH